MKQLKIFNKEVTDTVLTYNVLERIERSNMHRLN